MKRAIAVVVAIYAVTAAGFACLILTAGSLFFLPRVAVPAVAVLFGLIAWGVKRGHPAAFVAGIVVSSLVLAWILVVICLLWFVVGGELEPVLWTTISLSVVGVAHLSALIVVNRARV